MDREGCTPKWLKEMKWEEYSAASASQEQINAIVEVVGSFFATKTKAELLAVAVKDGCMFAPVNTSRDVFTDPQLQCRDFWSEVEHDELGARIPYPGAPCKLSVTPWRLSRRAPLIGEHNQDIFVGELGLDKGDLSSLKGVGAI